MPTKNTNASISLSQFSFRKLSPLATNQIVKSLLSGFVTRISGGFFYSCNAVLRPGQINKVNSERKETYMGNIIPNNYRSTVSTYPG